MLESEARVMSDAVMWCVCVCVCEEGLRGAQFTAASVERKSDGVWRLLSLLRDRRPL